VHTIELVVMPPSRTGKKYPLKILFFLASEELKPLLI
jgi:hypothetical protein